MSNETSTSNHGSHTCQSEVSTTLAMLISVFGTPFRADAEANIYEWRLELEGDGRVSIVNLPGNADKTAKLQRWSITADSKESLEQIQTALSSGENYYDGALHPELFIQRE
ncbi:MAG: hypothetical protein Q7U82_13200 [Gammaproteobacteria bacterium]|nr:hypothetical protein [Gammaproteobacteria bacterium]